MEGRIFAFVTTFIRHFSIIDINPSGYKSDNLYPTWKYIEFVQNEDEN